MLQIEIAWRMSDRVPSASVFNSELRLILVMASLFILLGCQGNSQTSVMSPEQATASRLSDDWRANDLFTILPSDRAEGLRSEDLTSSSVGLGKRAVRYECCGLEIIADVSTGKNIEDVEFGLVASGFSRLELDNASQWYESSSSDTDKSHVFLKEVSKNTFLKLFFSELGVNDRKAAIRFRDSLMFTDKRGK